MAQVIVRNLDETVKRKLKRRANVLSALMLGNPAAAVAHWTDRHTRTSVAAGLTATASSA